ncbi:MAG TPA: hypothetical protein VN622_14080 [Clostridia bacterium]|nr:hypothetical protein [Clostridia bacterium]
MKRTQFAAACVLMMIMTLQLNSQLKPGMAPPEPAGPADSKTNIDPLKDVAWLVGGTWMTDLKSPRGEAIHVENRIRWAANHRAIEFNADFNGEPHYNGFYAWDPAHKTVGFWYTSSEGELTIGTAFPDTDAHTLRQDFKVMRPDGATSDVRSTLVRDGENAYIFHVFGNKNGQWVEIFQTRYERKP